MPFGFKTHLRESGLEIFNITNNALFDFDKAMALLFIRFACIDRENRTLPFCFSVHFLFQI